VATLNFALSPEQKDFLYQSGYDTAKKFFDSHPQGTNRFGAIPAQSTGIASSAPSEGDG
jgi:hypothetical protein